MVTHILVCKHPIPPCSNAGESYNALLESSTIINKHQSKEHLLRTGDSTTHCNRHLNLHVCRAASASRHRWRVFLEDPNPV